MSRQKGFLLIEVVITTVIITIALVAAVSMFIQSTKAISNAERYAVAASLAQKQIEFLKSRKGTTDWVNVALPGTGEIELDAAWQSEVNNAVLLNHTTYTLHSWAETCPEDSTNLIQVRVTVSWGDRTGDSLEVTSFLSKL